MARDERRGGARFVPCFVASRFHIVTLHIMRLRALPSQSDRLRARLASGSVFSFILGIRVECRSGTVCRAGLVEWAVVQTNGQEEELGRDKQDGLD